MRYSSNDLQIVPSQSAIHADRAAARSMLQGNDEGVRSLFIPALPIAIDTNGQTAPGKAIKAKF